MSSMGDWNGTIVMNNAVDVDVSTEELSHVVPVVISALTPLTIIVLAIVCIKLTKCKTFKRRRSSSLNWSDNVEAITLQRLSRSYPSRDIQKDLSQNRKESLDLILDDFTHEEEETTGRKWEWMNREGPLFHRSSLPIVLAIHRAALSPAALVLPQARFHDASRCQSVP